MSKASTIKVLASIVLEIPGYWIVAQPARQTKAVRDAMTKAADMLTDKMVADDYDLSELRYRLREIGEGTDPRGGPFKDQALSVAHGAATVLARRVLR